LLEHVVHGLFSPRRAATGAAIVIAFSIPMDNRPTTRRLKEPCRRVLPSWARLDSNQGPTDYEIAAGVSARSGETAFLRDFSNIRLTGISVGLVGHVLTLFAPAGADRGGMLD